MSVAENIQSVQTRVREAALACGRMRESVHIVAVSKQQPEEKILESLAAGQKIFGENRVQEAVEHWRILKTQYPDLRLHLVGPLQTNKVKEAVSLFDVIETVDREKLARALGEEIKKQGRDLPCFIQVNTGAEAQKSGISPDMLPAFLKFCTQTCGLDIRGLMCIPPVEDPPALHFALLAKLAGENSLADRSMGMSGDFEKAIRLGATYIRLGTAIFGEREKRQ
jgi:pyridoxal phosphate enzyme (YggS family)